MKFTLPSQVNKAIGLLTQNGFEAYCVGGCVRDMVMGNEPHDYDLTSSASPDEMKSVFEGYRIIETGIRHGTLTVIIDSMPIEITTYRIDGEYLDNRHPESVSFSRNLKDDLSRRDFTVNTLCYNENEGIIDLFGGVRDINDGIIRCVGDPDRRFSEDALRIIRALRFSAVLGFGIEQETAQSILRNRQLLANISVERIRDEFTKLICADKLLGLMEQYHEVIEVFIPEYRELFGCAQNTPYHLYDVFEHSIRATEFTESSKLMRLTMFFHDISKPECKFTDEAGHDHFKRHAEVGALKAAEILRRMRYDNKTVNTVSKLIEIHSLPVPKTLADTKRFLNSYSVDICLDFIKVRRADLSSKSQPHSQDERLERLGRFIHEIIENGECYSLSQLAVNGNDIKALGIKDGKTINDVLNALLELVIEQKTPNVKSELIKAAVTIIQTD